jgi:hypothetical protein
MSKLKDHGCTINEHITSLDGNSCECGYFTHQLIQSHTNAEIAKTLDRLEFGMRGKAIVHTAEGWQRFFERHVRDAIQAERAKLKEVK